MERELRSLVRKNKAFSFMPGQSLRDEIVKLEAQIEHKDKALEVINLIVHNNNPFKLETGSRLSATRSSVTRRNRCSQ